MSADPLIAAVHDRTLPTTAARLADDPAFDERDLAARAVEVCDRIGAHRAELRRDVVAALTDAGVAAEPIGDDGPGQTHEIRLRVADASVADRAAEVLAERGYEPWEPWTDGAAISFRHAARSRTVAASGEVSSVVRLEWRPEAARSALRRAVTPTAADWSMVSLPTWAWWAYPGVRVTRLVAERLGLRRPHQVLGPFLATPQSLIGPLLDAADVTGADTLVDLGCGDGRIVVAAASTRGCRAIGVESDAHLAERARDRAADAAVGDQVRIVHGDARDADLSEATVLLLFLPLDVVAELLPGLLSSLPGGSRLVVHEQSPLPPSMRPDRSTLVLGDDAVTVAHRWDVADRG